MWLNRNRTGSSSSQRAVVWSIFAMLALSLFVLPGCIVQESAEDSDKAGENTEAMEVNDAPQDHLPVLNSEALSELEGAPEGTSGGLMSHQWRVSGQVVAFDEESGTLAVSVDSDNDCDQYLNSPILVSAGHEAGFVVGGRVQITFLPPGSEETVLHPSNLAKSQ